MSENESFTINDLMKKIIIISKNVKALSELVKTIDEKINQPKSNNEDDKDKMDKIFEKKGLGRPVGDYETKRKNIVKWSIATKLRCQRVKLLNITNSLKTKRGNMN